MKKDVAKKEELKFDYTDALNLECRLTEDEKMVRNVFHDYCQVKTPSIWSVGLPSTRDGQECLSRLLSGKTAINLECWLTEDEKMVRNVFHDYCKVKCHHSGVSAHRGREDGQECLPRLLSGKNTIWSVGSLRARRWSGMSSTTVVGKNAIILG